MVDSYVKKYYEVNVFVGFYEELALRIVRDLTSAGFHLVTITESKLYLARNIVTEFDEEETEHVSYRGVPVSDYRINIYVPFEYLDEVKSIIDKSNYLFKEKPYICWCEIQASDSFRIAMKKRVMRFGSKVEMDIH